MTRVLGINAFYHESAAALLIDHAPQVMAVEEERYNSIKHGKSYTPYNTWMMPINAIDYCLGSSNEILGDIDHIAYSFKPNIRIRRRTPASLNQLMHGNAEALRKEIALYYYSSRAQRFLVNEIPGNLNKRKRFLLANEPKWKWHFIEHHLSHAASAYYSSRYDESAILTIDGIGETTATLLGIGKGINITKIKEFHYPHSLGFFYEEITKYLGFRRNNDEFKVMGLASYGKPVYYDGLKKLLKEKNDDGYEVEIDFSRSGTYGPKEFHDVLGPHRVWDGEITQRHMDIAASAQKALEEIVLHLVKWLYRKTNTENLCLAGGVALNCVLNERIRSEGPFKNIFIQPASHDAGTALGAALYVKHQILGEPRLWQMDTAYLGPEFTNDQIVEHLTKLNLPFKILPDPAKTGANLIAGGKILGWFQGKMEFGPRSLGNRSILADPRYPDMKERINNIKGREQFRPLAPAIMIEHIGDYFEYEGESKFMQYARKVINNKRSKIPAVVHVDGTARLQTVSKHDNPLFYSLISHFNSLTGIPLVLNTSLNKSGRPIVCNIGQALDCFINTGLDCIVLGNCLISKKEITDG